MLHQLRMHSRQKYKRAIFIARSILGVTVLIFLVNVNHDQKKFWAIWKKRFMYTDVNINMLGCSNYTQASEKLAANFIANMNVSANSP